MEISKIFWDRKTKEKVIKKHHLTIDEVEEVFQSDIKLRAHAGIYLGLGTSLSGKYLVVVFKKISNENIKIVTAREMTQSEKRLFRR